MQKHLYAPFLALLFLCACSVMPQNTGERIAAAYVAHTELLNTTTRAVQSGRMSPEDARAIVQGSDDARSLLDVAADLGSDDILEQAIAVLEALERRVAE